VTTAWSRLDHSIAK